MRSGHKHLARWQALQSERSSWEPHWRELSDMLQPRLGRFSTTDRNRGDKKHGKIYDNTGTRALRVLGAGLMAGMTSPARPWFRLTTADPELAEFHAVKTWLSDCRRMMLDVYARSNTYRALQSMYAELGLFGTGASILLPDFKRVQHHYPATAGEYAIATDYQGRANSFYREMDMTVEAMVGQFGNRVSAEVRRAYDTGNRDQWRTVVHAIQPRHERDISKRDSRNMAWESCYFENAAREGEYLSESGFKRFRVLAPRWDVAGGDVYGHSPGMEALGDVKQLQHEQLRKAQGIDFMTKPPMQAPTTLKNQETNMLPGGITYVDSTTPQAGVRPMFETRIDLNHLLADIGDVRQRINASFYVDLFLMLAQADPGGRMTATEVAERHEEKLLMLGPVLERLHDELLDPMVESTFLDLLEANALPPPPPEMEGQPIRVEFVSMLAQAQRAIGTASIDRFVSNIGVVARQGKPEVLDKFDSDKWVDHYADLLGVEPDLIIPTDTAVLIRQERAKQQAAAEQAAMAEQMSKTAGNLAGVPTDGGASNAAADIMNLFQGYNSPSAQTY
jgi:hypothetical protein